MQSKLGRTGMLHRSVLLLYVVASTSRATLQAQGLQRSSGLMLERYNNTQALGTPVNVSITASSGASVWLKNLDDALSLRLQGTWTPRHGGDYVLHCGCHSSDHLFLWIDDHMMCDTHSWTWYSRNNRSRFEIQN